MPLLIDCGGNLIDTDALKPVRSFKADKEFGDLKEIAMMSKLKQFFKNETIKSTKDLYPNDPFCKWDFEDDNGIKWELKSRRNTYQTYPTTILPCHKRPTGTGLFNFVFQFTDGDYYIPYDEMLFNTFKTRMIKIYRAGKYDPPTLHWEIPITFLKPIKP